MIVLEDIHKSYRTPFGRKHVLCGIDFVVPPDKSLGILGRNGAGKSTLIRILSGLDKPDKGRVSHGGLRVSWPIGRGGVRSSLTGRDNVRFISRVYNMDLQQMLDFVQDFAELGNYFDMPVNSYSSGMRARLAFAISMACDFDSYLIDEGFSAGDARFHARMTELFAERRKRSNMIIVSHGGGTVRQFCDIAAILENGKLMLYESVEQALEIYRKL